MSNIIDENNISAFHPGYYVAEIIEDMDISQNEFAIRMGTTPKTLSKLINGQANISNDLAKKLSSMTGTSIEVWQNLQNTYDKKLIELQQAKDYDAQKEIAAVIDYKYFVENMGLPSEKDMQAKVGRLCQYFKIADLRTMLAPDYLVSFKSDASNNNEENIINSRAWLQTALNIANSIETSPFDSKKLRTYLPELRNMTVQKPELFLPKMQGFFSESGVAFVLLPHLKNSGINGAVKWLNEEHVLLAINTRDLYVDTFWFSIFHEIKHVLQKKNKTVFISSKENFAEINRKLEDDADRFAANVLIPPEDYKRFSPTKDTTDDEIIAFANDIGIHPGIVAGRLEHEGIITQNRGKKFKEKYILKQNPHP